MESERDDDIETELSPYSLVQELDKLFGEYYASKKRNDYFNESEKGKFWSLCDRLDIDHNNWLKETIEKEDIYEHLRDDNTFFPDFPCFSHPPFSNQGPYRNEQLMFVFDQIYERRLVPSNKELCMMFIPEFMSWFHIAESVKHQMTTSLCTKMKEVLEDENSDFTKNFELNDFCQEAVGQFVASLQQKRKLSNKEVEFIERVVDRAREFEAGKDIEAMKYRNGGSNLKREDFSFVWQGMNPHSLFDVYCVHKCHMFTFHQMDEYSPSEFVANLEEADVAIFGNLGLSDFVQKTDFKNSLDTLSLFPSWLINDDLFSIISIIHGTTDFVQSLKAKRSTSRTFTVGLFIAPHSVVSLYDHTVYLNDDIPSFSQHLEQKEILQTRTGSFHTAKFSAEDILRAIQKLYEMIQSDDAANIGILIERRQSALSAAGQQELVVFECAGCDAFEELRSSHLIGFDFEVSSDVVRAYLNYGIRQRTRFYPEFMVSVVPKLFVFPSDMTDYEFVKKLYSAKYKRRWNVNLEDTHFNVIYKAITGYDHETNNYFRAKNCRTIPDGRFLEFAEERLLREQTNTTFITTKTFLKDNAYDSDAVIYDVLIEGFPNDNSSNLKELFQNFGKKQSDWHLLRDSVFEWLQDRCGMQHVLDVTDCVRMRRLICNLRTFREANYVVNESNSEHFNLEQIIADFDHLVAVHKMFSDDETVEIQRFVSDRIRCTHMHGECPSVSQFRNRRSSRRPSDQHIEDQLRSEPSMSPTSVQCAVLTDTLNGLHCYLLHQTDEPYRQSADDEHAESRFTSLVMVRAADDEQTADEKKEEPLFIDFGVSVLRWLRFGEEPEFDSLRDQMVHNIDSSITHESYDRMEIECIAKIKNKQFEDYTLDELVGLKFYSDSTKLCALLRKTHWKTTSKTMKKRYYYWAQTIYRAALRHAKPIPVQPGGLLIPSSLYHGLTLLFRMDQESPLYFGPFSTTLNRNVANTFTKEQGLRLLIKSEYGDIMKRCLGIDMRTIAAFKHEQEILLVDQVIPIQSRKSYKTGDEASINHLLFSLKTRRTEIRDPAVFYRRLGIKFKNEWTERVSQHPQLHAKSQYQGTTIKHRLTHELRINEHFVSRVVIDAIKTITVDQNLCISQLSIPRTVQQFKAGDIINLKRDNKWIKSTVSRVFAESLCVRTVKNGKCLFRWLEGNTLSDEVRIIFPQQNICSRYQFTFQNLLEKSAKVMLHFTDLQNFNIPFVDLLSSLPRQQPRHVQCLEDALDSIQIGVAVRDDDWNSVIPIRIVQIPIVSSATIMSTANASSYSSHSESFRISTCINMNRHNGRNGGKLRVISPSSIIIEAGGGINGSECGLQRGSKRKDPQYLKYGRYIGLEPEEETDTEITERAGGGVLILSATQSVVNHGVLLCDPSKGGLFSGGSICVLTVDSFVNFGRISCGTDGTIRISCRMFINRGLMTPAPFIEINDGQSVGFSFKALVPELSERNIHLSWYSISQSVTHEMGGDLGILTKAVIDDAKLSEVFDDKDLSDKTINQFLDLLQAKKALNRREITFIQELVLRARGYMSTGEADEDPPNNYEISSTDFSPKWIGLKRQTLFDVYTVHKCFRYTFRQMRDYTLAEFIEDVVRSEDDIFGNIGISDYVHSQNFKDRATRFTLFPSWLIDDDVFSIIPIIYGVTNFAQNLIERRFTLSSMSIGVYIIPHAVVSLYDQSIRFDIVIPTIEEYLNQKQVRNFGRRLVGASSYSAADIGDFISELHDELQCDDSANIIVLFDRRKYKETGKQEVGLFECVDLGSFAELRMNNLIGFDLEIDIGDGDDTDSNVARTYLNYGTQQRTRFYPEFMMSVVPKLFVTRATMSEYEFISKLYSAEYKKGWNLNLDDAYFNVIYKAITGTNHETNNYYRSKSANDGDDKSEKQKFGFFHFVEKKVVEKQINALNGSQLMTYWKFNGYDSDTVIFDILDRNTKDEEESNVGLYMKHIDMSEWSTLKYAVFDWKQIDCGTKIVFNMTKCAHIQQIIACLQRFKANKYVIDAVNMKHFNLSQIVGDFNHLVSVHAHCFEDTVRIQRYITSQIDCEHSMECFAMKHFRNRRRGMFRDDDVSSKCDVLNEIMCEVHCYLLHRMNELYRSSTESEKTQSRLESMVKKLKPSDDQKQNEEDTGPPSMDFGISVTRWLPFGVEPLFDSLRDEILYNKDSSLNQEDYEQMEIMCTEMIKNTDYSLYEMMGLTFYIYFSAFTRCLRKAHWKSMPLEMKRRYYNWARCMYLAALRFAVPMPLQLGSPHATRRLYHGMEQLLQTDNETPIYFGPMSTTYNANVAMSFAKRDGKRLTIIPEYGNAIRRCLGIDIRSISSFPHEQEVLLIDQPIPVEKTKILKSDETDLVNHLLVTLKNKETLITNPADFWQKLGLKFSPKWTEKIAVHSLIHTKTQCQERTVFQRLVNELDISGLVDLMLRHFVIGWTQITVYVEHELYPLIATSLRAVVDQLQQSGSLDDDDLTERTTKRILKTIHSLNCREEMFLRALVQRTVGVNLSLSFDALDDWQNFRRYTGDSLLLSEDFTIEWSGLHEQALYDVYAVHKCHCFTFEQMSDYPLSAFERDVKNSDVKVSQNKLISEFLQSDKWRIAGSYLSLYPSWLLKDDVFEIFTLIHGITSFVTEVMETRENLSMDIKSFIIPQSIGCVYDTAIEISSKLSPIKECLQNVNVRQYRLKVCDSALSSPSQVSTILEELYDDLNTEHTVNLGIFIDRRNYRDPSSQTLAVFDSGDWNEFHKNGIRTSHSIGFDFDISQEDGCDVVRAYLNYGRGQRIRFYPEFMMSVIPKLFVSTSTMTTYEFIRKLYSPEYKHGWRVNLDDEKFNVIYKAITGYDHVTNNYFRPSKATQAVDSRQSEFGFFEWKWTTKTSRILLFILKTV